MRALPKKNTPLNEDLNFAVNSARQELSNHCAEVNPSAGMLHISGHILVPFRKLHSFRKWDKGMVTIPEDETSYTTLYQEAFLKYVENEYCAKHRCVPVIQSQSKQIYNLFPSSTASGSGQPFFNSSFSSSDYQVYLKPNNVAETTAGRSDRAAHLLTAPRLHLNSLPG